METKEDSTDPAFQGVKQPTFSQYVTSNSALFEESMELLSRNYEFVGKNLIFNDRTAIMTDEEANSEDSMGQRVLDSEDEGEETARDVEYMALEESSFSNEMECVSNVYSPENMPINEEETLENDSLPCRFGNLLSPFEDIYLENHEDNGFLQNISLMNTTVSKSEISELGKIHSSDDGSSESQNLQGCAGQELIQQIKETNNAATEIFGRLPVQKDDAIDLDGDSESNGMDWIANFDTKTNDITASGLNLNEPLPSDVVQTIINAMRKIELRKPPWVTR